MRRGAFRLYALFLALMVLPGATAAAGEHMDRFWLDYERMNCWPEPFQSVDRAAARSYFSLMKEKGWRLENTMADHHFDPDTNELNRAGELKIKVIVTEMPANRRVLFVLRHEDGEKTMVRLDSVQRAAARFAPQGALPPVMFTDVAPRGWPADYIDAFGRRYQATIPDPRLPAAALDSAGGE
jgi:hypothetical protein